MNNTFTHLNTTITRHDNFVLIQNGTYEWKIKTPLSIGQIKENLETLKVIHQTETTLIYTPFVLFTKHNFMMYNCVTGNDWEDDKRRIVVNDNQQAPEIMKVISACLSLRRFEVLKRSSDTILFRTYEAGLYQDREVFITDNYDGNAKELTTYGKLSETLLLYPNKPEVFTNREGKNIVEYKINSTAVFVEQTGDDTFRVSGRNKKHNITCSFDLLKVLLPRFRANQIFVLFSSYVTLKTSWKTITYIHNETNKYQPRSKYALSVTLTDFWSEYDQSRFITKHEFEHETQIQDGNLRIYFPYKFPIEEAHRQLEETVNLFTNYILNGKRDN